MIAGILLHAGQIQTHATRRSWQQSICQSVLCVMVFHRGLRKTLIWKALRSQTHPTLVTTHMRKARSKQPQLPGSYCSPRNQILQIWGAHVQTDWSTCLQLKVTLQEAESSNTVSQNPEPRTKAVFPKLLTEQATQQYSKPHLWSWVFSLCKVINYI